MFDGDRVKDSDHGTAHRAIETVHAFDVGALSGRSFGAGIFANGVAYRGELPSASCRCAYGG